ncbi:uncharacterized protein DS421_7g211780 [Arachis hypogaea]|nr:uncharacterized protein DS421_7g211780 [Arachis hypogaea]
MKSETKTEEIEVKQHRLLLQWNQKRGTGSPWDQVVRGAQSKSTVETLQLPSPPSSTCSTSLAANVASVSDQLPTSDSSPPKVVNALPLVDNWSVVIALRGVSSGSRRSETGKKRRRGEGRSGSGVSAKGRRATTATLPLPFPTFPSLPFPFLPSFFYPLFPSPFPDYSMFCFFFVRDIFRIKI